jgi:hypothetical protein
MRLHLLEPFSGASHRGKAPKGGIQPCPKRNDSRRSIPVALAPLRLAAQACHLTQNVLAPWQGCFHASEVTRGMVRLEVAAALIKVPL